MLVILFSMKLAFFHFGALFGLSLLGGIGCPILRVYYVSFYFCIYYTDHLSKFVKSSKLAFLVIVKYMVLRTEKLSQNNPIHLGRQVGPSAIRYSKANTYWNLCDCLMNLTVSLTVVRSISLGCKENLVSPYCCSYHCKIIAAA